MSDRACKMTPTNPAVENERPSSRIRFTKGGRRITYQLSVVQQPERARACGQGAKSTTDRRPVDPPPIVDLRIFEGEEGHLTDITFSYRANIFLFASLESARSPPHTHPGQTGSTAPVLTGTPVAGISYLDRPNPAGYFIFPDLSVRHEGKYRLAFNLFEELKDPKDEDSMSQLPANDIYIHGRCEVKTKPFTVFSAKRFPGLMESTSLSRMVADQGCRVRIRRDVRMRRRETKGRDKWDDYEDETAHERAKRESSPCEYPAPPSITAHLPVGPAQAPVQSSNLNNNHAPYGSSNPARQTDLTTSYQSQQAQSHQPQQMPQPAPSAYPPYVQYETAQMQQYMAQNSGYAQYPQHPTAYGYPSQQMMPYAAGYAYLPQQGLHHASMYEPIPPPSVDHIPPPSTYQRQTITAPSVYSQPQPQEGDMRQPQSSDQAYIGPVPLQNSTGGQQVNKGLPRLPNQNFGTGRVDSGFRTAQLPTYPPTPRSSTYLSQVPSNQKRSYAAAFDVPPYDQPRMQLGSRPQTSQYARPEQEVSVGNTNEEPSSDAESLELEQLTMTYRRADGTERTRKWPQLRT